VLRLLSAYFALRGTVVFCQFWHFCQGNVGTFCRFCQLPLQGNWNFQVQTGCVDRRTMRGRPGSNSNFTSTGKIGPTGVLLPASTPSVPYW
jgi:hypothetical protein